MALAKFDLQEVHSTWRPFFQTHEEQVNAILSKLIDEDLTPSRSEIFKSFRYPLDAVRALIIGQDPYPGESVANGLAFSTSQGSIIPASLRNIFKELQNDLGIEPPHNGDLSRWSENGVMLLNRVLTTKVGASNAHICLGWEEFTYSVAEELANRGVVAILWGSQARKLSYLFENSIESVHPSPLSAYRGFFGSRPFSQVNAILQKRGEIPIAWKL
jgi:uracil-DNA glycosylase